METVTVNGKQYEPVETQAVCTGCAFCVNDRCTQLNNGEVTCESPRRIFVLKKGAPTGRKDDSGKLDMTLLDDMPRAIKAVVEVMQWAITEKMPEPYRRGSWLGVEAVRYEAAQDRHRFAAALQASLSGQPARFERDGETKLLHAAHRATSALMALENTLRELEQQA